MPIVFHENSKTFHLYNKQISYIFCILKNGQLGQLYFGKKIHDREDFSWMLDLGARDMTAYPSGEDRSFSLESIKQEYPSFGSGDMRYPAFQIKQASGSEITAFTYAGHRIFAGKKKLRGLPAVYVEADEEAWSQTGIVYISARTSPLRIK